jgi:HAMP domain-containing protein
MKRKIAVVTAVILASLIVTALLESITLEHVIGLSPSQSETMVILQKNAMDSLYSNVIGSFKSDYQLMTISRDGEILKTFQLPKDERFTFSDYDSMTVYDGYIYLHRMVKNPDDYFVLDEQVIRISAADGSIVVMFEAHYPEGVEYPLMTKMYRQGDMMMVVTDDETVEHTIHISQINLLTGTISALRTLKIDPELNLVDVLYLTSEDVVMSAADGKLYHFNEAGMSKIQYAGMPDLVRPEQLIAVGEERIAFYDHLSEDFVEMDLSAATYEVVREGEASVDVTRGLRYGDAFGLSITEDNVIAGSFRLNADHHRYIFLDDQRVMTVLDDLHYGSLHSFGIWCVSAAFFGLIAALVYALAALYRMRGGSLIVKFILILLPLVLIIPVIALSMSLGYFMQQVQNDLYAELYYIASEHVSDIDVQSVLALDNIEAYHSPAYYALDVDRQMTAVDYNDLVSDTFDRWYYSVVYRVEDDRIYTLVGDDVDYWIETRHIYGEKGNEAYLQAVTTGKTALGENSDTTGVWVFAVAPILDDSGDVVGLYEVGTGEESYLYFILSYYGKLSVIILGVAGIVLALMGIIIYRIILPLRNLNTSAKHIAAGEWGTTVSFNTMDEVGHLANAFNRMSLFIKDYINELTALNKLLKC